MSGGLLSCHREDDKPSTRKSMLDRGNSICKGHAFAYLLVVEREWTGQREVGWVLGRGLLWGVQGYF